MRVVPKKDFRDNAVNVLQQVEDDSQAQEFRQGVRRFGSRGRQRTCSALGSSAKPGGVGIDVSGMAFFCGEDS